MIAGLIVLLVGGFVALCIDIATYTTFYDKYYKIEMKYPVKWKKLEDFQGAIVAFVAPVKDALEPTPPNVNVTVTDNLGEEMSLEQFARFAMVQTETILSTSIEVLEKKPVTLSGGQPAYSYTIKSKVIPTVQMKFVLYLKDNKGFIITCMADESVFKKNLGIFNEMIKSYKIDVKK